MSVKSAGFLQIVSSLLIIQSVQMSSLLYYMLICMFYLPKPHPKLLRGPNICHE